MRCRQSGAHANRCRHHSEFSARSFSGSVSDSCSRLRECVWIWRRCVALFWNRCRRRAYRRALVQRMSDWARSASGFTRAPWTQHDLPVLGNNGSRLRFRIRANRARFRLARECDPQSISRAHQCCRDHLSRGGAMFGSQPRAHVRAGRFRRDRLPRSARS